MPTTSDYDPKDDEKNTPDDTSLSGGSGGAAAGNAGSANGPRQAAPSAQQSNTFVPWDSFVNANKDVSARNAQDIQTQVKNDATNADTAIQSASDAYNKQIQSNYGSAPTPSKNPKLGSSTSSNEQNTPPTTSAMGDPWANLSGADPKPTAPTTPDGTQSYDPNAPNYVPVGWDSNSYTAFGQGKGENVKGQFSTLTASGPKQDLTSSQNPALGATKQAARSRDLLGAAASGNPVGAPDLEAQMGPDAWNALLGQTGTAQSEANAVGNEQGVQAILQQSQWSPEQNTAFDAALVNGQGGPGFQQLNQQYGGGKVGQNLVNAYTGSQDAWKQLQGDISTRQAFDAARTNTPGTPPPKDTPPPGDTPPPPTDTGSGWTPPGYSTLDNFMDPGSNAGGGWAHTVATDASPADDATFLAGLAGYNGENVSQLFAQKFGANGNVTGGTGDFFIGNLHNALGYVGDRYGHDALQKWWSSLTPDMWKNYEDLGNGGAMARNIIQWLRSAGFSNNSNLPDGC